MARAIKKLREYYRLSGTAGQLVAEFIVLTEVRTFGDESNRIVELVFRTVDPYTQQAITRKARYDVMRDEITEMVDVQRACW